MSLKESDLPDSAICGMVELSLQVWPKVQLKDCVIDITEMHAMHGIPIEMYLCCVLPMTSKSMYFLIASMMR